MVAFLLWSIQNSLILYKYLCVCSRSEKIAIVINITIIIMSTVYSGIVVYLIDPSFSILMLYQDETDHDLGYIYAYGNAITRSGPYFIGFLVGYISVTRPNLKFPKVIQVVGWCLAVTSSGCVLYATALWYNVRLPSRLELLLYASFYNVAFTAGIAWMTLCCINGQGGFINRILSWNAWVPFSKLTLGMYLIQPIFQTAYISVFRSTQDYTHLNMIMQAFGFMCISMLLAVVLNLLVESPFLAMEKLLFRKEPNVKDLNDKKERGISNSQHMDVNGSTYASYTNSSMENIVKDSKI